MSASSVPLRTTGRTLTGTIRVSPSASRSSARFSSLEKQNSESVKKALISRMIMSAVLSFR